MQNNKLTKSAFVALLLVSAVASADTQYPASDFQPSVVFQDETYINSSQTVVKVETPAAKVPVATTHNVVASDETDIKYPAANFQPTVIFSDPNYQHSGSVVVTQQENNPVAFQDVATEVTAVNKKDDDSSSYLIGLIGLAIAGFFLFRGQGNCPVAGKENSTPATAQTPAASALTGVARYLNKKAGTGVSRYLERQSKTAATGVARYVARQVIAKAKKETTGVEKYVRDRG